MDKRGQPIGYLYTGIQDQQCSDHAAAFLEYLAQQGWLGHACPLRKATVPRQDDGWSCGHRAILAANLVLEAVVCDREFPVHVDVAEINLEQIHVLMKLLATASTLRPLRARSKEPASAGALPADPAPSTAADPAPSTPPPRKRDAQASMDAFSPEATSEKSTPRAIVSRADGSRQHASKSQTKRASSKAAPLSKRDKKRKLQEFTAQAEAQGVTHRTFQRDHYAEEAPPPAGHWEKFLESMEGPCLLTCPVCIGLRKTVLRVEATSSKAVASQAVVPLQDVQPLPRLGAPSKKKGRPQKQRRRGWPVETSYLRPPSPRDHLSANLRQLHSWEVHLQVCALRPQHCLRLPNRPSQGGQA